MTSDQQPLLQGHTVSKYFGGLAAVNNVDFAVYPGEVVGLIGILGTLGDRSSTSLGRLLSRVGRSK